MRVKFTFSPAVSRLNEGWRSLLGGQIEQDRNGTSQFEGQMDRPPTSQDSIKSAVLAAARVYEVRLERAAHTNSPSL